MAKGKKQDKVADPNNPENLESAPSNTLFGKKRRRADDDDIDGGGEAAAAAEPKKKASMPKKPRAEVSKEDPVVAELRAKKRREKDAALVNESSQGGGDKGSGKGGGGGGGDKKYAKKPDKSSDGGAAAAGASKQQQLHAPKPHAEAVDEANKMWEKLRSEKTAEADRHRLVDDILQLFDGKILSVLQKHDAARVLQSCYKQGSAEQREALMRVIAGEAPTIARSHYGHFLLLSIVRHGVPAHKSQLLKEITPAAADMLVHAEGSAVLQLLYADVASAEEKTALYRALWGKELLLFGPAASGGEMPTSLPAYFESDPLAKPRTLRRLEVLLSKAARKGLAPTALVQRAAADLMTLGDATHRTEIVSAFRDQAVHIMHTRDGARIACGCMRHGDAKDRKALLKALKGYANKAALDPHGSLFLCTALETVDDTVLLSKGVLSELLADLGTIALHPQGALPLLQLLAPRAKTHFTPEQLGIMGVAQDAGSSSKKDPSLRRSELLKPLLPQLLKLCTERPLEFAVSPHGSSVLFEALTVGLDSDSTAATTADGDNSASSSTNPNAAAAASLLTALAKVALQKPAAGSGVDDDHVLVAHAIGARVLKRLVQQRAAFAEGLLSVMKGNMLKWAKQGAGWVLLAMLENAKTRSSVATELKGSAAALAKLSANGCKSLGEALKKA